MTPNTLSFVLHFGEMGSRWGFNRTVGQIYALLVLSEDPISANEISEQLNISRGNVSMSLKELSGWRLIQTIHKPGDRKDYYQTLGTVWDMAEKVFEERKKREIDPTLSLLRNILLEGSDGETEDYTRNRIQEILELLEKITQWTQSLQSLPPEQLETLIKLGGGVGKVLSIKDKLLNKKAE